MVILFMKKILIVISYVTILLLSKNILAAKVNCNFDTGEAYDISTGAWLGQADWESIWDIFGEGLELDLDNVLLAKLDTQEIFLAGETPNGEVYLAGSDYGVYGRLSGVEDGMIYIYSGFCDVGFG